MKRRIAGFPQRQALGVRLPPNKQEPADGDQLTQTASSKPNSSVIRWLLDSDPSIRWQVMRDLTDAPADEVATAGARLLALQAHDERIAELATWSHPSATTAAGPAHPCVALSLRAENARQLARLTQAETVAEGLSAKPQARTLPK